MSWQLIHHAVSLVILHKDEIKAVGEGFEGLGLLAGAATKIKEGSIKAIEVFHRRQEPLHITPQASQLPPIGIETRPAANESASPPDKPVDQNAGGLGVPAATIAPQAPLSTDIGLLINYRGLANSLFARKAIAELFPVLVFAIGYAWLIPKLDDYLTLGNSDNASAITLVGSLLIGVVANYLLAAHLKLDAPWKLLRLSNEESQFLDAYTKLSNHYYREFLRITGEDLKRGLPTGSTEGTQQSSDSEHG